MNIDEAIKLINDIKKEYGTMDALGEYVTAIETLINEYNNLKDLSNELQIRYTIENMKYKNLKEIEEAHRKENGELKEKISLLENEIEGLKQTFAIHDDTDNHIPHID